jgi:DMSO/TMAO reductase YedYZ molybdopterin-dependent catalytic subunit
VWHDLFSQAAMAPIFDESSISPPRQNGNYGLESPLNLAEWRCRVEGPGITQEFDLDFFKSLPSTEIVTQLCCIEGWKIVVKWKGVRFSEFFRQLETASSTAFVFLETPDREYFVGIDWASAMHPQTLLCYEMNGEPLSPPHGAPLRLVIPTKYGIKNIKRIGLIRFTDERPRDYWASEGYDWYAGL